MLFSANPSANINFCLKKKQEGNLKGIIFANCDNLSNFVRNYCNNSTVFIR